MKLNEYITLGRSGLRVSPLSLGTMTFGTEWGWGNEEDAARAIFSIGTASPTMSVIGSDLVAMERYDEAVAVFRDSLRLAADNTVALEGKTRDEVVSLLGDPQASNDSIYNFPFWPAPRGALVYRFDCGAYGWQFNVVFGLRGRLTGVERLWIH